MRDSQFKKMHAILESAFQTHHSFVERERDPVCFVHKYSNAHDQEVVALFAALLAYGNVSSILSSIEKALRPLGEHPARFIRQESLTGIWKGFKHRFTTGEDLLILGTWLKSALNQCNSLEEYFLMESDSSSKTMRELLSHFVERLSSEPLPPALRATRKVRERNLKYLLSHPERGSACKRLNLFLRWMVRPNDGIDLGIWKRVSPSILMLPVDTHLLQTLQKLRWTKSKQANWSVVEEATTKLKCFSPEDPIRYDFSLCHLAMRGGVLK